MESWESFGKHLVRFEQDVAFVRLRGDLTGQEIATLLDQLVKIEQPYGRIFEIVDAHAAGTVSAAARRENAEWHRRNHLCADVVVYGGSVVLRTIFKLFGNAIRLFQKSDVLQMQFVATEAEAIEWVKQRRQELSKRTAKP